MVLRELFPIKTLCQMIKKSTSLKWTYGYLVRIIELYSFIIKSTKRSSVLDVQTYGPTQNIEQLHFEMFKENLVDQIPLGVFYKLFLQFFFKQGQKNL